MTSLADHIADAQANSGATLRTGRVIGAAGTIVTVDIGGGQVVDMPALAQYEPILGDIVMVQQQGPLTLVLGRTAAIAGDNVLANPSFELDPAGTSGAAHWTFIPDAVATTPITATTQTATQWGAAHGSQWLELSSSTASGDGIVYAVSEAIPVTPGERWTAAAYTTSAGNQSNIAGLWLTWYASSTAMYPSTVSADTLISSASFPSGVYPRWLILRELAGGGTTVPVGVTFMRVVVSAEIFDIGYVYVDAVIARKVS